MEHLPAIINQVAEIGKTVHTIVAVTSLNKQARKMRQAQLDEQLKHLIEKTKVINTGELIRACINEMRETNQMIMQFNDTDDVRSYEELLLGMQYKKLEKIVYNA